MTRRQRSILAVALLSQGISVGLTYGLLPVFLETLEAAFAAPRTVISAGQILIMLSLTVGSLLTGVFLDRGYARSVMIAGALLMASAQALAALAPNLWVLGLAAVMAGFSVPSIGPLAGASLVTRVFDSDRGRALGLMAMGPPLGSGVFAALAGQALLIAGWREAFAFFALVPIVLLVPLVWLAVPARLVDEIEPDGPGGASEKKEARGPQTRSESGSASEAIPAFAPDSLPASSGSVLARPVFWWTAGVFALAAGVPTGWTVHVAAYLGGVGLTTAEQSTLLAAQFWMGVPGALVFGMLADRMSLTLLFVVMLGGMSCALLGYALWPSPLIVAGLGVGLGFTSGGMIPLYMMLLGRRVGPDVIGRAMGLSNLFMLPVMAASVWLAASVFESQGSYVSALVVFAIALILAIGCVFGSSRSAREGRAVGR